jgi:rubrerythrin
MGLIVLCPELDDNFLEQGGGAMKKAAIGVFLCVFLANAAGAQSVAELARRQKARRAALKGKPAAVITNKDLAKVKRTPALVVQTPVEITAENVEAAAGAETPPAAEGTPPAAETAPPAVAEAPAETGALTDQQYKEKRDSLAAAAARAQEYADLLQLRLGQLWQQYYNLDDMAPKDAVQAQISEVYTKMQQAQADALKVKTELETFLATAKRESTPSIWIK